MTLIFQTLFFLVCSSLVAEEQLPTRWLMKQGTLDAVAPEKEAGLLKLFRELGIQIETIPSAEWDSTLATAHALVLNKEPEEAGRESSVLWEGRHVKLYSTAEGRLRITPIRKVEKLHELTNDERLEMETIGIRMSDVFFRIFGSPDYVRWVPLGKSAGQVGDQVYSELIPTMSPEQEGMRDAEAKVRTNLYVLLGYKSLQPGLSTEQIGRIQTAARDAFTCQRTPADQNPRPAKWMHVPTAGRLLVTALLRWLHEVKQAAIPLNSFEWVPSQRIPLTYQDRESSRCAFCNPEVISRQLVHDQKDHVILANHAPYFPLCHLMSIPKAHVADRSQLTANEILEKYRIWVRADQIFRNTLNSSGTSIVTRCGPTAGQTVLHDHDHLLAIRPELFPTWILFMLHPFMGENSKIPLLNNEDFKEMREGMWSLFEPIESKVT